MCRKCIPAAGCITISCHTRHHLCGMDVRILLVSPPSTLLSTTNAPFHSPCITHIRMYRANTRNGCLYTYHITFECLHFMFSHAFWWRCIKDLMPLDQSNTRLITKDMCSSDSSFRYILYISSFTHIHTYIQLSFSTKHQSFILLQLNLSASYFLYGMSTPLHYVLLKSDIVNRRQHFKQHVFPNLWLICCCTCCQKWYSIDINNVTWIWLWDTSRLDPAFIQ